MCILQVHFPNKSMLKSYSRHKEQIINLAFMKQDTNYSKTFIQKYVTAERL